MVVDQEGFYSLAADEYHADPCVTPSLSSTLAKTLLLKSPLHAYVLSSRLSGNAISTDSKTFDLGRAAHEAVLGKGGGVVEIPDDVLASNGALSTKAAKEFIEAARLDGKTPLKSGEIKRISKMADCLNSKLKKLGIKFNPDHSEKAAFAHIDGVWCRAMFDNAPNHEKVIYDFKTCESADPLACERSIINYGYDIQAAHYLDVWHKITGETRAFRFVFQEKQAPFDACVLELDSEAVLMGAKKARRAREIWKLSLEQDYWEGYPLGIHKVSLPAYYHEKWLNRELSEYDFQQTQGRDIYQATQGWQAPLN